MIESRSPQISSSGIVLGEVQPVGRVDALSGGVDDRTQRVQERGAAGPVGERVVAARHLLEVGAETKPHAVEQAADLSAGLEQARGREHRQHEL